MQRPPGRLVSTINTIITLEFTMYEKTPAGVLPVQIEDRREMLRIKLKSLMWEARIIRKEEARTFGRLRSELWFHRVVDVRAEARATHLAYGFIRGKTWDQMEPVRDPMTTAQAQALASRIRAMIRKYGPSRFVEPEDLSSIAA